MNSLFKVGDVVHIRKDLTLHKVYFNLYSDITDSFTHTMEGFSREHNYTGKIKTVLPCGDDEYKYLLEGLSVFTWTDTMFELPDSFFKKDGLYKLLTKQF